MLEGFLKNTKKQSAPVNGAFLDSDRLKQANEALYKQGAELAARNKTLSLLDRLYAIATHGDEVAPTAQKLAQEIVSTFDAPYAAILFYEENDKSLSLVGYVEKQAGNVSYAWDARVTDKEYPGFKALRTSEPLIVKPNGTITGVFFPKQNRKKHLRAIGVVGTFIYPLFTERGPIGLLIIGLNRQPSQLSAFERGSIGSAVNVVAVAIDRTAAYAKLKQANTRLKELDELKTEFMSIASHQLRTPLSIIKGYTSLMDEGAYGAVSKQGKGVLHNIDISNERLIKLVDEFLNVSRIEQGRTQFSFAEMDAADMARSIVVELNEKAGPKKIKLNLNTGKGIGKITADEDKLRHCIYNYIDNAIKYSPEKSEVKIYLEKEKSGLRVRVVDRGVGMDQKDMKNMFQKFYRSPHVLRDFQGTGLGLFVVQQFITAHGGRVWAKSKGVGQGSEFGFWIPLKSGTREAPQRAGSR